MEASKVTEHEILVPILTTNCLTIHYKSGPVWSLSVLAKLIIDLVAKIILLVTKDMAPVHS